MPPRVVQSRDKAGSDRMQGSDVPLSRLSVAGRRGLAWSAAVLLMVPFVYWIIRRCLTLDFWYDELYTLKSFVFVPISRTLTDYSEPNNHVFFNLLNNLYCRCVGLHEFLAAMDEPWLLRVPPLVYSLLTLGMVFAAARRRAGDMAGCVAVAVLATTVPFFNLAAQMRGYSLSMLLLVAMVYFLLRLEDRPKLWTAITAAIAGALALYTTPSNLYFLLSGGTFYAVVAAVHATGTGGAAIAGLPTPARLRDRLASRYLAAALAMVGAVALAMVLYAPILRRVVANPYVQSAGLLDPYSIGQLLPQTWWYLLSHRHVLVLLPAAAGAALMTRSGRANVPLWRAYLFCLAMLVLPFAWSSLRGDHPPDRIFANLAPVWALFVAVSARIVCDALPVRPVIAGGVLVALVVYCQAMFVVALRDVDRHLLTDIEHGRKSQDACYAYHQAYYEPYRVIQDLAACFAVQPGPVFVYEYGDEAAATWYMQKSRIAHWKIEEVDTLAVDVKASGVVYVVTAWPARCRQRILERCPGLDCHIIGPGQAFYGLLICREKPTSPGA